MLLTNLQVHILQLGLLKTLNTKEWVLIATENDFRLQDFKFKTVRLILFTGKNMEKYGSDELIFQYGKSFTVGTKYENSLSIRPIVTNLSFWKDLECQRSETPLILLKKGIISKDDKIIEGRLIDDVITMDDTREAIDFELLKLFKTLRPPINQQKKSPLNLSQPMKRSQAHSQGPF